MRTEDLPCAFEILAAHKRMKGESRRAIFCLLSAGGTKMHVLCAQYFVNKTSCAHFSNGLNIAYIHPIVVLVILYYHMLQNKQSNRHSLYSMTSVVALFTYLTRRLLRRSLRLPKRKWPQGGLS